MKIYNGTSYGSEGLKALIECVMNSGQARRSGIRPSAVGIDWFKGDGRHSMPSPIGRWDYDWYKVRGKWALYIRLPKPEKCLSAIERLAAAGGPSVVVASKHREHLYALFRSVYGEPSSREKRVLDGIVVSFTHRAPRGAGREIAAFLDVWVRPAQWKLEHDRLKVERSHLIRDMNEIAQSAKQAERRLAHVERKLQNLEAKKPKGLR